MMRLFSLFFLFTFSTLTFAQDLVFQGRVDFGRDLASFEASPPMKGTLYLLSGAVSVVRIVSEDPFLAEVEFVQGEWKSDSELTSHRALLQFEGSAWAKVVAARKPRQGAEAMVYPYRKIQVAVQASDRGFRVFAVTSFF